MNETLKEYAKRINKQTKTKNNKKRTKKEERV